MKKWSDDIVRKPGFAEDEPVFYLRGSHRFHKNIDGYTGGHELTDKIISICQKERIESERNYQSSMGSNVEFYVETYPIDGGYDGCFVMYSGNYWPYDEPSQGSYIHGFKALRWFLEKCGYRQPRKLKGEMPSQQSELIKNAEDLPSLCKLVDTPKLPIGEDLLHLLRVWFPFAPTKIRSSSEDGPSLKFLRWAIGGRIEEVLKKLEIGHKPVDKEIAERIINIGNRLWGLGIVAAPHAYGLFGWLGKEIGNPTWENHPGTVFLELPTDKELEELFKDRGGIYIKNYFFRNGCYKLTKLTDTEKKDILNKCKKSGLNFRSLYGQGKIIYGLNRKQSLQKVEK